VSTVPLSLCSSYVVHTPLTYTVCTTHPLAMYLLLGSKHTIPSLLCLPIWSHCPYCPICGPATHTPAVLSHSLTVLGCGVSCPTGTTCPTVPYVVPPLTLTHLSLLLLMGGGIIPTCPTVLLSLYVVPYAPLTHLSLITYTTYHLSTCHLWTDLPLMPYIPTLYTYLSIYGLILAPYIGWLDFEREVRP
jgi:hypothetical protein